MGTFSKLVSKYGFSGLVAFLKLKSGVTGNIRLQGLAQGISLRPASSDITVFKHIFAHGDYGLQLEAEPEVIIDAGANIGLAAVYFANRFSNARIIAIELSPANYKLLCHNTGKYPQIVPVHAGLWPRNEVLKFKEDGINPWGYKVDNALTGESISVNSITLPEILQRYRLDKIDLLKIDIEGAEVELFSEGYEEWLPRIKHLVIEFHDRWRPESSSTVKKVLSKYNFVEQDMVGENAVFSNSKIS